MEGGGRAYGTFHLSINIVTKLSTLFCVCVCFLLMCLKEKKKETLETISAPPIHIATYRLLWKITLESRITDFTNDARNALKRII